MLTKPEVSGVGSIEARLVDAFRVLRSVHVTHLWPQSHKVMWPDHLYSFDDKVGQEQAGELERDAPPPRLQFGPDRVQAMEEAIEWPLRFLQDHPGPAKRLNAYCHARAVGYSFTRVMKREGWNRDTTYRFVHFALRKIAERVRI